MNMPILLALGWEHYAFTIPISLLSIFLSLVILVQRGRGGGLTGALGGMGGQSAFGTKAGDLFTRITVGVAAVWILLSMAALKMLNKTGMTITKTTPDATAPAQGGTTTDTPATGATKTGTDNKADKGTTKGTGETGTGKTGKATPESETGTDSGKATSESPPSTTTPPAPGTAPATSTTPAEGTPPAPSTPATTPEPAPAAPPASTTPPAPTTPDPAPAKAGDEPTATKAPE